jgi:hypothetical protein
MYCIFKSLSYRVPYMKIPIYLHCDILFYFRERKGLPLLLSPPEIQLLKVHKTLLSWKVGSHIVLFLLNIWWPMPLFVIFISQIRIETSTFFIYSNFAWVLHGGVDVKWSGGLLFLELHCRDCGRG